MNWNLMAKRSSSGLQPFHTYNSRFAVLLLTIVASISEKRSFCLYDNNRPFRCGNSTVGRSCEAYAVYPLYQTESPAEVAGNLFAGDETSDSLIYWNETQNSLFVALHCSCTTDNVYLAYRRFRMVTENSLNSRSILQMYRGLAWIRNPLTNYNVKPIRENTSNGSTVVMTVPLLCRCPDIVGWDYMLSYVAQPSSQIDQTVTQYGSNLTAFLTANNLTNGEILLTDYLYYIPIRKVSGVPLLPSPASGAREGNKGSNSGSFSKRGTVLGIAAGVLSLIITITTLIHFRNRVLSACWERKPRANTENSLICSFGSKWSRLLIKNNKTSGGIGSLQSSLQASISKETSNALEPEKAIRFKYKEVVAGTLSFAQENFLAQSWYGSTYRGILRGQHFDIKRMEGRQTPELLDEIRNICKLHHANLAALIGYAWNGDELILVYESAESGILSDRLHNPAAEGSTPLTWNARLHIALDVGRALEYIHERTQVHYVHCFLNTNNILLDSDYEAKVGEFGLSRLLTMTGNRGVATEDFGMSAYMAPEFLKEGKATAKSDAYAFGVFVFELITGQRAAVPSGSYIDIGTSSATGTLSAFKESQRPLETAELGDWADPNLLSAYPPDLFCRTAALTQRCLEDDPSLRPEMREIVLNLSYILLESIEWDAALAGGSQIFSDLIEGR